MRSKIIFFLLMLSGPVFSQTKIQAWRCGFQPSLILTDKQSVIETKGALSSTAEEAFVYIEEMIVPKLHTLRTIFSSFTKKNYSSYILIQVMDAFTDEEIFQIKMEEPGSLDWQLQPKSDRVYFIVRIFGQDIELRTVGMISEIFPLAEEDKFILSPQKLYAFRDTLSIKVNLIQDAALSLFIYDSKGVLAAQPANNVILPAGDYEYFWDPSPYVQNISGEEFQVWMKAVHPSALPVEMTKTFLLIP